MSLSVFRERARDFARESDESAATGSETGQLPDYGLEPAREWLCVPAHGVVCGVGGVCVEAVSA